MRINLFAKASLSFFCLASFPPCALGQGYQNDLQAGRANLEGKNYAGAEVLLQKALAEAEASGHGDDLTGAAIMHLLGIATFRHKDAAGSESLFEREAEIRNQRGGKPREAAMCIYWLGNAGFAQGDYSNAQANFQSSLSLLQSLNETVASDNTIADIKHKLKICARKLQSN